MSKIRFLVLMLVCGVACSVVCAAAYAQASSGPKKAPLSPPATATISLNGKSVSVDYSAPSMRGRVIMGGLVPYNKVWRTGANAATTLKTAADLKIGTADVPAGTYTLYTWPTAEGWKLIINRQTGQWGTVYNADQDLARVDMKKTELAAPQERMSISFEKTSGGKTQMHVRWEKTDVWVPISLK